MSIFTEQKQGSCSQRQNRVCPGSHSSAGNGNSGLPGSCKGSKWLLELASVPQWRWKWVIAPALGTSGRPKLPCGPFWEPDGALEMVAPVCLGITKALEMVAHACHGDTGAQCARKYCSKVLSLLVCSLHHFSLMNFHVFVFWWRYGM